MNAAVSDPSLNLTAGKGRRSVLIIDDDPVFALLAGETLQQSGFDARIAGNKVEALESFAENRPDLVLLDVDLPDCNGFKLCAELRAASAGHEVPVVMVTGHGDTGSIAQAYEVGATDFIQKPVLWPTLPHRVGFMLRALDDMHALRASEQKNRALLQALPDTLFIVDDRGVVMEHVIGTQRVNAESLVNKTLEAVFPFEVAQAARACLQGEGETDLMTLEFETGAAADRRWFEARFQLQADGPLLIVTRDTTERHRAKARIEYLAYYDVLTSLPNRLLFMRKAARALREAKRDGTMLALLYLDLDRFKRINDNLGHAVGDALLQQVARRLEDSVRPTDIVGRSADPQPQERARVARLGGDEFVILLTGITAEVQTVLVAERIQQSLEEAFECSGHRFVVTPSIGIAIYPRDATEVDDLLVKADMAMYQAKDQGRNGHAFYGQSMAVRSLGRLELENDLRRGFDAGEFQVHYQPKLDLSTNQIIGVEALLRWNHPSRGSVPPDTFIRVAEETGMIIGLGDWVIDEACRQLKLWAADKMGHLTIAVNVSVQQFDKDDFVESVLETPGQTLGESASAGTRDH